MSIKANKDAVASSPEFNTAQLDQVVQRFVGSEEWSLRKAKVCRANTDAVLVNVCRAVKELSAPAVVAQIARELPTVTTKYLSETRQLAFALNFTTHELHYLDGEQESDLERGRSVRKKLFRIIQMAVDFGAVPVEVWTGLRKTNGKSDIGHDLVNAVELLRANAEKLDGRTFATRELLADSAKLGQRLIMVGAKASAAKTATPKSARVQTRDRLFTLLVERYDRLGRIASWLWGAQASQHVPALRSASRRSAATEETSNELPASSSPVAEPASNIVSTPAPVFAQSIGAAAAGQMIAILPRPTDAIAASAQGSSTPAG